MVYNIEGIIKRYKIYGFRKFLQASMTVLFTAIYYRFLRNSYSQKGEDLVIDKVLGKKKNGFYIDVGANDPVLISNTYRFYKKGWTGINIEPNPLLFKKLAAARNRDINLNIGIAEDKGEMTFFSFFPNTQSTFSEQQAEEYLNQGYPLLE